MGRWKEGLLFEGVRPMPWLKSAANWFPGTEDVQPDEMRVTFMGTAPNNDMPRLLNSSEVFVLSSNYEGSPKALLEAMACGLPVIGTNVPGIREVIQHGVNGLLCEPNENHIASAIVNLLSDSDVRRRLGHQARQDVLEKHSQSGVAKREAELIQRMLEGALE